MRWRLASHERGRSGRIDCTAPRLPRRRRGPCKPGPCIAGRGTPRWVSRWCWPRRARSASGSSWPQLAPPTRPGRPEIRPELPRSPAVEEWLNQSVRLRDTVRADEPSRQPTRNPSAKFEPAPRSRRSASWPRSIGSKSSCPTIHGHMSRGKPSSSKQSRRTGIGRRRAGPAAADHRPLRPRRHPPLLRPARGIRPRPGPDGHAGFARARYAGQSPVCRTRRHWSWAINASGFSGIDPGPRRLLAHSRIGCAGQGDARLRSRRANRPLSLPYRRRRRCRRSGDLERRRAGRRRRHTRVSRQRNTRRARRIAAFGRAIEMPEQEGRRGAYEVVDSRLSAAATAPLVILTGCVPAVMTPTVGRHPGRESYPLTSPRIIPRVRHKPISKWPRRYKQPTTKLLELHCRMSSPGPVTTQWLLTPRRHLHCSSNTILPTLLACTPEVITYPPTICSRPTTPNRPNRPPPITGRGE